MDERGVGVGVAAQASATAGWWRAFVVLFVLLFAVKLALAGMLPLFGDEAFYWLESRHLAPAYDDVPGLVPWLIRASTWLFGHSLLAVRLPFLLLAAASVGLVVAIARTGAGARAGWQAGCAALLLPLFAIDGLLALPDVPLTLAVLLAVHAQQQLLAGRRGALGWLALAFALGWLSHYRFVLPLAAGALYWLFDRDSRRRLRRPGPWLAALAGNALGLAPLLWHQWAERGHGFAFQFAERHPWRFHADGLAELPLQALPVTPALFLLLLAVVWSGRRRARTALAPLFGNAVALLLLFELLAPFVDAERSRFHWPFPAWLLLAAAAPAVVAGWPRRARIAAACAWASAACVLPLLFGWLLLAASAPARLAAFAIAYPDNFAGWRPAAALVRAQLAGLPADTLVVADNFMLAAELSFALDGRPVYSLDHRLNRKHGRQGALARFGLDEAALARQPASAPRLLIASEGASSLRDRPAWFRRLCQRFPHAEPRFDLLADHGRKRLLGWLDRGDPAATCLPPAFGYLESPAFGARLSGTLEVAGWALREQVGLGRLRLVVDGQPIADLPRDRAVPALFDVFPGLADPAAPQLGFERSLQPRLPAGRHWLQLQAESADGGWYGLVSLPFDWQPPAQGSR